MRVKGSAEEMLALVLHEKEREIDDMVSDLKEMHRDKRNLSDPQYRLWARMSKDDY